MEPLHFHYSESQFSDEVLKGRVVAFHTIPKVL